MGNALAPWIFCLAIDPIVRYANRIPGVIKMNAYMDDTNTAGKGKAWLKQMQTVWEIMKPAGLIIAKHNCIEILCNGTSYKGASVAKLIRDILCIAFVISE